MTTIPIILTFDSNMSLPAAVCISSLMMSAREDTFYDIIVLHSGEPPKITNVDRIKATFPNLRIQYRSVGDAFNNAFEIRGITTAAYYRLLAPRLIPEYDKAIYSDVDVIFRMDLSTTFSTDLEDCLIGAVPAEGINESTNGKRHLKELKLNPDNYVCSGFLLMDLKKLRENNFVDNCVKQAANSYKYQDQDIINIVCQNRIRLLPTVLSMGVSDFFRIEIEKKYGTQETDIQKLRHKSNIHYNGQKPWKGLCPNFDIWWEFYRKSPVYNSETYFRFFYNQLEILDKLPLLKRVKILIRYFVYGQKKDI